MQAISRLVDSGPQVVERAIDVSPERLWQVGRPTRDPDGAGNDE